MTSEQKCENCQYFCDLWVSTECKKSAQLIGLCLFEPMVNLRNKDVEQVDPNDKCENFEEG